jgi:hypothetical protein
VEDNTNVPVFTSFTIQDDVTDVSTYVNAEIVVNACAIQTNGFEGKTAAEVFKELPKTFTNPNAASSQE